jgi:hypothetical protein
MTASGSFELYPQISVRLVELSPSQTTNSMAISMRLSRQRAARCSLCYRDR